MADRGNCKVFAPNYFNPTKCQNCFKPKEQHTAQPPEASSTGKQPLNRNGSSLGRNALPQRTVLKESVLWKGVPESDGKLPEEWNKHWYTLLSSGELQEFAIVDGQINKEKVETSIMLQEFIRMLDGKVELGVELCFGVKTLRDTIYYKTTTKVDYENWWKEFSSFVAAPIKRTTSSASVLRSNASGYSKPNYNRQVSVPSSSFVSKPRNPRSSSVSAMLSDSSDSPQMETLRNQVSKLEEENTKLSKSEEQRRKLELEVNYWKEYVTNSQALKRSGGSVDAATELADARRKLIQLQDELNETQKKLKLNTGKLLMQNKELTDAKEKLREANSLIAVHKAKIEQVTKELSQKNLVTSAPSHAMFYKGENKAVEKAVENVLSANPPAGVGIGAQHLEDKFLLLKDRLKRIERELFLKSKELEKANESRSKVAKYTRSLLQELETRLSDNQHKLIETEEKLKNANTELALERERRIRSEDGPRRRMSSVVSPPKQPTGIIQNNNQTTNNADLSDQDAEIKYVDYYRSRFKESEAALLEKDKKLHQAEEKIKELNLAMKSNSDSYKVMNDLQTKLSDATHKLSDRQLKIHELTREIDRLKGFEKTYEKKSKQCDTLEDIVKDLEGTNTEQSKNLHQAKQELEILKIREVVLKEQLQTFAEDSESSDEDMNEDDEEEEDHKLDKSIDLKKKIECMIELEAIAKKLTIDNEKLTTKSNELEMRLRNLNIQSFKTLEANKSGSTDDKPITSNEKEAFGKSIRELEKKVAEGEDKYCNQLTFLKNKHYSEILLLEKKNTAVSSQIKDELAKSKSEIENLLQEKTDIEGECNELRGKVTMLQLKVSDIEETLSDEMRAHKNTEALLAERTNLMREIKERSRRVTIERDTLKEGQVGKRTSFGSFDEGAVEKEQKIEQLNNENHDLKVKVRQLDRKLRVSLERFEDVMTSVKENDSLDQDRDSGIVITQEIKNMIDSYKRDEVDGSRPDSDDIFVTPRSSVSSESESIEKYKKICTCYEMQFKELGKKLISSEEKVVQLATDLQKQHHLEEEYILKYNTLITRIEDLQTQILESQESLQTKADELERERKNVINLVEVTSAYIKELEGSLTESKTKIQELQNFVELTKQGDRQPPDGSAGQTDNDNLTANNGNTTDDVKAVQLKLTAKIMTLQSDISELKASHANELKIIQSEAQQENEKLRRQISSFGMGEDAEDMFAKIESLETQLQQQKDNYTKDVVALQQHFQTELKAAFSGDSGGMEILNRVQELEIEIEETRKDYENKLKEAQESYEEEKEQMKDDMATVLQASLSVSGSGNLNQSSEPRNATAEELEERVIKLEQELVDMQEKYQEELEMEKEAHQREMEDTIRDMMMVRNAYASNRYEYGDDMDAGSSHGSFSGSFRGSDSKLKKMYSVEEVDELKADYEKKLEMQVEEHEGELTQVRDDMAIVISSLKQGSSSETILELQAKIKDLEQEIEDMRIDFDAERGDLELKLKRAESANFFGLRRNEEMGSKIFAMQIELEEIDRKHQNEIQVYIDKLSSLDDDAGENVGESLKLHEELHEKNRELENKLDELSEKHEDEMNAYAMRLQEEKREAIEDMTDKVLKLEALIDEMKESHEEDMKRFEKLNRDEKQEVSTKEKERIKELEVMCENLKEEYEEEIEELAKEHKKEVEKLRLFYEKEIGDMKRRSDNEGNSMRRTSLDQTSLIKQSLKEQKEKFEKETEEFKSKHASEKQLMEASQQREIDDIRNQYDEKLKMSYKEGLRRQSVSDRKSDGTRMRELIAEKDVTQTKLLEVEIRYENDTKELQRNIVKLQEVIADLKGGLEQQTGIDLSKQTLDTLVENEYMLEDEAQKKLKETQEQIERYERRIEYYKEKSERENTEESHRVSDLQSEIVELHAEMNNIRESRRKEAYDKEKKEKTANSKTIPRRNTDGSTPRRHTDTDTIKTTRLKERDPRQRWSNLEERSEKEEGKSGTVLARKTLWENIRGDELFVKSSKPQLSKTMSNQK